MSQQTRQETETRTVTYVESTTCDLCGVTVQGDNLCNPDMYEVDQIRIERTTGTHYPEEYDAATVSYDVCPKCWDTVIVPLFKNRPRREPA